MSQKILWNTGLPVTCHLRDTLTSSQFPTSHFRSYHSEAHNTNSLIPGDTGCLCWPPVGQYCCRTQPVPIWKLLVPSPVRFPLLLPWLKQAGYFSGGGWKQGRAKEDNLPNFGHNSRHVPQTHPSPPVPFHPSFPLSLNLALSPQNQTSQH